MTDDDEIREHYETAIKADTENINRAMDSLIDSVSTFKASARADDLTPDDYANMLFSLDYAKFIISGVMYLHGLPLCGHDHEDEEED